MLQFPAEKKLAAFPRRLLTRWLPLLNIGSWVLGSGFWGIKVCFWGLAWAWLYLLWLAFLLRQSGILALWQSGLVTNDNERGSPGRLWHCVLVVIFRSAAQSDNSGPVNKCATDRIQQSTLESRSQWQLERILRHFRFLFITKAFITFDWCMVFRFQCWHSAE